MTGRSTGLLATGCLLVLTGCAAGESPELACQKRLVAAREAPAPEGSGDDAATFGYQAYAAMDRTGCTAKQLAALDRITALTKALPGLTATNNQIGASGTVPEHLAAFQRMNNSVIELNELQQVAKADLANMLEPR